MEGSRRARQPAPCRCDRLQPASPWLRRPALAMRAVSSLATLTLANTPASGRLAVSPADRPMPMLPAQHAGLAAGRGRARTAGADAAEFEQQLVLRGRAHGKGAPAAGFARSTFFSMRSGICSSAVFTSGGGQLQARPCRLLVSRELGRAVAHRERGGVGRAARGLGREPGQPVDLARAAQAVGGGGALRLQRDFAVAPVKRPRPSTRMSPPAAWPARRPAEAGLGEAERALGLR
jgi:hypothetical protein